MKRERINLSTYVTLPVGQVHMNVGDLFIYQGYKTPFRVVEILEKGLKAANTWNLKVLHFNVTGSSNFTYNRLHNCAGSLYKPVSRNGKIILELQENEGLE